MPTSRPSSRLIHAFTGDEPRHCLSILSMSGFGGRSGRSFIAASTTFLTGPLCLALIPSQTPPFGPSTSVRRHLQRPAIPRPGRRYTFTLVRRSASYSPLLHQCRGIVPSSESFPAHPQCAFTQTAHSSGKYVLPLYPGGTRSGESTTRHTILLLLSFPTCQEGSMASPSTSSDLPSGLWLAHHSAYSSYLESRMHARMRHPAETATPVQLLLAYALARTHKFMCNRLLSTSTRLLFTQHPVHNENLTNARVGFSAWSDAPCAAPLYALSLRWSRQRPLTRDAPVASTGRTSSRISSFR
ncbi:hypothetical protein BC628DRAFT_214225 [Trametes gibbosa]|nr:hypothetical protein BC628DRAFT_214225 [Trametes gibbosa]